MIEVAGEHIMSVTDELKIHKDFFGADEAITNYKPNRDEWVATLIFCENSREAVRQKRNSVISDLKKRFKAERVLDSGATAGERKGFRVQRFVGFRCQVSGALHRFQVSGFRCQETDDRGLQRSEAISEDLGSGEIHSPSLDLARTEVRTLSSSSYSTPLFFFRFRGRGRFES